MTSSKHFAEDAVCLPGMSLSLVSSEDYEPTSTLQYINSQLVAHGFARSPGLSLDGLANKDSERFAKCILGMLSQRMEDLGRTEDLSSKLRTLNYEHERLQSMHRTAIDNGVNAEREMNLFKSKLAASKRSLTAEAFANKQTLAELQRTRTSLQYLRSTTQNELKRKDKEVGRILDRWNKIADTQVKLLSAPSGLQCANYVAGTDEQTKGKGLMEAALEQAEEARGELVKENEGFRTVLLRTANLLQGIVYTVKGSAAEAHIPEPPPLSHPALFTPPTSVLSHPENAYARIRELISNLREVTSQTPMPTIEPSVASSKLCDIEGENKKLKELVTILRTELDQSRRFSTALGVQSQALLDRFTTHASQRFITGRDPTPAEATDMSMELMGVPEQDAIREKLDSRTKALEQERQKFTVAAVQLGKDKAALAAERVKFLEEKRRWDVAQMLTELPPTPGPDPDLLSSQPTKSKLKHASPSPPRVRQRGFRLSSRSPPKKTGVMKGASTRATVEKKEPPNRAKKPVMRREGDASNTLEVLYDPERRKTESNGGGGFRDALQGSTTPEDSPPITATPRAAAEIKTASPLVLPTTFTLPPPSPGSSMAAVDLGSISSNSPNPSSSVAPSFDAVPLAIAPPRIPQLSRSRTLLSPRTPHPALNSHLKHAYSPVRPSPLSRILMLANSPASPHSVPSIQEVDEQDQDSDVGRPQPGGDIGDVLRGDLVQHRFGMPIDEPSALRECTKADLNGNVDVDTKPAGHSGKDFLADGRQQRFTAKEKGKGRAASSLQGPMTTEKENVDRVTQPSRGVKSKAAVSAGIGAPANRNKIKSVRLPGSDTKGRTATGRSGFAGASLKTATSSRPTCITTEISSPGNAGVMAKAGGTRRVPTPV